jgi:hypothetical protein
MNAKLQQLLRDLRNPRSKSFWALVLVVVYSLLGFLFVPWLIKDQLPSLARDTINRDASVAEVSFNPWSLELTASGLEVRDDRDIALLELNQLYVNLEVSSLVYRAFKFREIALTGPDIQITRYPEGDSNIALLLDDYDKLAGPPDPDTESAEPLRLIIDNLAITDGRIGVEDQVPANSFNVELAPLNISVQNLSTLPDDQGEQVLTVTLDGGSQIELAGSLQLNPLLASGSLNLVGSPIPVAQRYLDDQLSFKLRDEGFGASFGFAVREADDQSIAAEINDLNINIDAITADSDDGTQRFFSIPQLSISGGDIAWPAQKVRIKELRLTEPAINVELAADGTLNLETLASPAGGPAEAEAAEAREASANEPVEWQLAVDAFRLDSLSTVFRDLSLRQPGEVSLAALNLVVNDISTAPNHNSTFALDATLASGGRLDIAGNFSALPDLTTQANVTLTDLALAVVQPWAADAATIIINDGLLGASGSIMVSPDEQFAWQGDIGLANLDISDSAASETLAGVKSLNVNDSRLSLSANQLEISSIDIDAPFARVIINEDATTNFGNLATDTEPAESEAPAADSAPLVIKAGKTTVSDGSVDFADFSLPLPFRALITEFGGDVSAIASNSTQPSVVDFEGKVGEYGLANVDGSVSVLDPTNQTEIDLIFRNVNMPELSPYTVEFAGRTIEEGKLDLDLSYSFADNRMLGNNKIVLTTFLLGDEVESENAMSLPLDIAVALLTDVNGVIDLNLQVEGDLDDPSFSVAGIVLKALANLIVKAAAAPFKLLGALVPGLGDSEDIGNLRFAAGEATLLPPAREKLDGLASALPQRPSLRLKVPAGYATDLDSRALKAAAIETLLEAELEGTTTDTEQLTERTRKALEKIARDQLPDLRLRDYRTQFEIADAETGAGSFDEIAYMADLRAQLEALQVIDETQLVTLAKARQQAVIDYLLANATITPERLLPGETSPAEADEERWIKLELGVDAGEALAGAPVEVAAPAPDPSASGSP